MATSAPRAPTSGRGGMKTGVYLSRAARPKPQASRPGAVFPRTNPRQSAVAAILASAWLLSLAALPPAYVARGHFATAATTTVGGSYHALQPARILDTRSGAPVGPGGSINVPVAGQGGVPAANVAAVVLNVTVTDTN